jgi:hypothetical protein
MRFLSRPGPWVLAGACALAAEAPALDLAPRDLRLRTGMSLDPDQFHMGVQAALGSPERIAVRPSLDVGFGNGLLLFSLNGDVLYLFGARKRLQPYLGGGPALSLVDVTDGVGEADGVSAEFAGHLVGGLQRLPAQGRSGRRYQVEARAGFGDTPNFKLTLAIGF